MLDKAIVLAATEFEGVFDKGGNPYILHCLYVMDNVTGHSVECLCAAVLHDIIEDTAHDRLSLRDKGISDEVINIIEIVTHKKNESYDTYIKRIAASKDKRAIAIKRADLRHNSDITRLKGLRKKDFERLEKYSRAYTYLGGE